MGKLSIRSGEKTDTSRRTFVHIPSLAGITFIFYILSILHPKTTSLINLRLSPPFQTHYKNSPLQSSSNLKSITKLPL